MMRKSTLSDYDELMASFSGGRPGHRGRGRRRGTYATRPDRVRTPPTALSASMDDGEVLTAPSAGAGATEYVVDVPEQQLGAPSPAPSEAPAQPPLRPGPEVPDPPSPEAPPPAPLPRSADPCPLAPLP